MFDYVLHSIYIYIVNIRLVESYVLGLVLHCCCHTVLKESTGFRALCRSIGCDAASFELDDSPLQNFMSGIGFVA